MRFWGTQHPEPFTIRPFLVMALLFGPTFVMGVWVVWFGSREREGGSGAFLNASQNSESIDDI